MTDKNAEFARKITAHLDRGAAELKPGTAYRLQQARAAAVARLSAAPAHAGAPVLAGARTLAGLPGHGTGGHRLWTSGRLWLGIALIAAASLGYQQWQAWQAVSELEETDAALLTSDLPIDAYLDRGFQNWLKTSSDE
jgi:hypothetical protein